MGPGTTQVVASVVLDDEKQLRAMILQTADARL
jgi:hypothetical protein